jgi:carbon monoxide dehydrogenase subunit G
MPLEHPVSPCDIRLTHGRRVPMAFRFEETFQVQAPIDRVWRYLTDPRQVVACLPGAAVTGAESDRVFFGTVKATVGPVTGSYSGRAELTEVDHAARVVRLRAEGRESGGAGSAKLRMTSRVIALDGGGAEVRVEAEVDVAGKIMQFGRGMIDLVGKQLFRQFAECARAELEMPDGAETAATAAATIPSSVRAGAGEQSVRIIPLLIRALWSAIKRLIGRGSQDRA